MSETLRCSCGCDRFVEMTRITTRGTSCAWRIVYACEACGKRLPVLDIPSAGSGEE